MQYRPELTGLRALAILPVVIFHAGFGLFPGGFLGVDIFFVLSGYLITRIIVEQIQQHRFSLSQFYLRRARRILPALFLITALSIPASWYLMLPEDLENFGQSVFATVLFTNNVLLSLTSGYWVQTSELKPLIHTWSLGVEEQYYLLIPILLLLLINNNIIRVTIVFTVLFAISLAASEYMAYFAADYNFYLIFSRVWEFSAGSLVALLPNSETPRQPQFKQKALSIAGAALILAALFTVDRLSAHPGVVTLPIVLGTALIIRYATAGTLIARLLSSPLAVFIGLISYSMYLWHQPLFAFTRLYSLTPPSGLMMGLLALATIPLAWISWRYVEQPCRDPERTPARPFLIIMAGVGTILAIIGLLLHFNAGFVASWPEYTDDEQQEFLPLRDYNESANRFITHQFSQSEQPWRLLVVGDSFARDFINAGQENGIWKHVDLAYRPDQDLCFESLDQLEPTIEALFRTADYVVLGTRFNSFSPSCAQRTIAYLKTQISASIIILGTKHFGHNIAAVMRLPDNIRYSYRAAIADLAVRQNQIAANVLAGNNYLNIIELLSDDGISVPVFTPAGKFISADSEH
ncbi:MAG: acyltransferase family protein, partial [bacterium]